MPVQTFPSDIFHHQEDILIVFLVIEDIDNTEMREFGLNPGFLLKPLTHGWLSGIFRGEHLDCHFLSH
jgi:hypothetical protein